MRAHYEMRQAGTAEPREHTGSNLEVEFERMSEAARRASLAEHGKMQLDPEQHMVLTAPASMWKRQYEEADEAIRQANGGQDAPTLNAAAEINYPAFCKMIEALVALAPLTGLMPDDDLQRRARMVPVDQAIL